MKERMGSMCKSINTKLEDELEDGMKRLSIWRGIEKDWLLESSILWLAKATVLWSILALVLSISRGIYQGFDILIMAKTLGIVMLSGTLILVIYIIAILVAILAREIAWRLWFLFWEIVYPL